MPHRIFRTFLLVLVVGTALYGCAPVGKSTVWKDENVSLAVFRGFEIKQVEKPPGESIDPRVLALITSFLEEQFKTMDLPLADPSLAGKEVLVVRTEVLRYGYESSHAGTMKNLWQDGWGKFTCTLRTRLIEKEKGHTVARIVTTQEAGGLLGYFQTSSTDKRVIESATKVIAEEVVKIRRRGDGS